MTRKIIYLSYHRGADAYQRKLEELLKREFSDEIQFLKGIDLSLEKPNQNMLPQRVADWLLGESNKYWRETNEYIKKSVVIFLITDGWYAHHEYELQVTTHHNRPFVVVYCGKNIYAPETFPDVLRQSLDEKDAVNLFKDAETLEIDDDEMAQLLEDLRTAFEEYQCKPSRKNEIRPTLLQEYFIKRINQLDELRKVTNRVAALLVSITAIYLFLSLILSGAYVDLPKVLGSLELAISTPHPLPHSVSALGNEGLLTYHLGEVYHNISFFDLNTSRRLNVLVPSNYDSSSASWSCDGQKIAYASNQGGNFDIYIVDFTDYDFFANGAPPTPENVTNTDDIDEGFPDWSPDGNQLVFSARPIVRESGTKVEDLDLYILTLNARETENTKKITFNDVVDQAADWSCANGRITFESGVGDTRGSNNIYVLDPKEFETYDNGTGINLTIETNGRARFPAWSCEGTKIAFHASPDGKIDAELFVMDFDIENNRASNFQQLTNNTFNDFGPAWSPDGSSLVFQANGRNDDYDLYIIELEHKTIKRLTDTPEVSERYADWRPSGQCS